MGEAKRRKAAGHWPKKDETMSGHLAIPSPEYIMHMREQLKDAGERSHSFSQYILGLIAEKDAEGLPCEATLGRQELTNLSISLGNLAKMLRDTVGFLGPVSEAIGFMMEMAEKGGAVAGYADDIGPKKSELS